MGTQLQSVRSTAQILGVSPDTIRRLIAQRELRSVRISRRVMICQAEIDRACLQGAGSPRRHPATVTAKSAE